MHTYICISISISIYLSVCLSIDLSIDLSIYLSIYLYYACNMCIYIYALLCICSHAFTQYINRHKNDMGSSLKIEDRLSYLYPSSG